jgi:hypothetical protein
MASRMRLHEDLIRHVFNQLDADHDGFISLQDLRSVLGETVDGEDIRVILQEADLDGDGQINFDEFEKCFNMIGPIPVVDESESPPPPLVRSASRQQSMKVTLAKLRAVSALSKASRRTLDDSSIVVSSDVTPSPVLEPITGVLV